MDRNQIVLEKPERAWRWIVGMLPIAFVTALGILLGGGTALADDDDDIEICSFTARLQDRACRFEVSDDHWVARAICFNLSDEDEREECVEETREARHEGRELCRDQRKARQDLCDAIGEEPYDPDFDPEDFDDDFVNPTNPNSHFPLLVGNRWVFEGEDETITIEVLNKTKLIDGVTCVVVNDVVTEDDLPIEDTDDWFGQRKDGTVDYCGESVQDFEYFEGDDPMDPELVETDGSFKQGRDGDKAGTLFPGSPQVGDVFRQEWSASNAEDAAEVLSTTYRYGEDENLDQFVPQDLADYLCDGDCVVLKEFSPLEPGGFEHKYFAPDVGKFLEVNPEDEEFARLVECNVHPKCDDLPLP